jgi:Flp pilus assembly protein TadD
MAQRKTKRKSSPSAPTRSNQPAPVKSTPPAAQAASRRRPVLALSALLAALLIALIVLAYTRRETIREIWLESQPMESLRRLADKEDADALVYFVYARRQADAGAAAEAIRPITRALQSLSPSADPGLAYRILALSGYISIVSGNTSRSEEWLQQTESFHQPDDIHYLLGKGILALRRQHAVEATDALTKAAQLAPSRAEAWSRLGEALVLGAEPERAVEAYRRAVALAPKDPQSHAALGHAWSASRQYAEADKEYRIAADLAPQDPNFTSLPAIGHAYSARTEEEYHQAVSQLSALLAARPEDTQLRSLLAGLHMRFAQYPAARREMEACLSRDPGNVVRWHTLALVCERSGDQRAADAVFAHYQKLIDTQHSLSELQIAATLHPQDEGAFLHFVEALRQAGQDQQARAALSQAAALHPDDPQIAHALQDLERTPPRAAPPPVLYFEGVKQP